MRSRRLPDRVTLPSLIGDGAGVVEGFNGAAGPGVVEVAGFEPVAAVCWPRTCGVRMAAVAQIEPPSMSARNLIMALIVRRVVMIR
jgi:hypothetical protein